LYKLLTLILYFFVIGCQEKVVEDALELEVLDKEMQVTQTKMKDIPQITSLPNQVQVGIESISREGDQVEINIYALNPIPIAGLQFDLMPKGLFEIESVSGGRCADLDFTMHSSAKGTMLGFSMKGTMIPVSESNDPKTNILFTAIGKAKRTVTEELITLESVIAGKGGVKIVSQTLPYTWTGN